MSGLTDMKNGAVSVAPKPVSRIGVTRLPDLRRYLQALAWRTTKLPDDPSGDARRLADIAQTMSDASICGLGQTAGWAVQSALKTWPQNGAPRDPEPTQLTLFAAAEERLRRELAAVDPERLTPLEALQVLARLVETARR